MGTIWFLVDGLHAIIALYLEEGNIEPVRRFLKSTGLVSNDLFMRTFEVALKVIPRIGDDKKRIPEEKALLSLWLAMDEIKAKVSYKLSCVTVKLWTDEFRFIWEWLTHVETNMLVSTRVPRFAIYYSI